MAVSLLRDCGVEGPVERSGGGPSTLLPVLGQG